MDKKDLPFDYIPFAKDADWFLDYWKNDKKYSEHERSLNKLFGQLCPNNDNIEDILIKCSALNDFYSTNIFDVHKLAEHILRLDIDERLRSGDDSLVEDIANVEEMDRCYFSFATKYCSHHQPEEYAIYDSYVEKVLLSLNRRETFTNHKNLKDYPSFMFALDDFKSHFGLLNYTKKEIDMYLWQLGKWYFNPYLTYKYYNREGWNREDCPFDDNDVRSKFWFGEMMFVRQHLHLQLNKWKKDSKESLKNADERTKQWASKFSFNQLGLIKYISELFAKWCPYDDGSWIFEY